MRDADYNPQPVADKFDVKPPEPFDASKLSPPDKLPWEVGKLFDSEHRRLYVEDNGVIREAVEADEHDPHATLFYYADDIDEFMFANGSGAYLLSESSLWENYADNPQLGRLPRGHAMLNGELVRELRKERDSEGGTPVLPEPLMPEVAGLVNSEGLTLFAGREGSGKSTLAHTIAAQYAATGGVVAWFKTDEDLGYKLRKKALSGQENIVAFTGSSLDVAMKYLVEDADAKSAGLVVVDPLRDLLGAHTDNDKSRDVRSMLAELLDAIGDRACIGVHHLRKGFKDSAPFSERLLGSSEYVNVAAFVVGVLDKRDTKLEDCIVAAQVKNKLDRLGGVWRSDLVMRSVDAFRKSDKQFVKHKVAIAGLPERIESEMDADEYIAFRRDVERVSHQHADRLQIDIYIEKHGGRIDVADLQKEFRRGRGNESGRWTETRYRKAVEHLKNCRRRDMETKRWLYDASCDTL